MKKRCISWVLLIAMLLSALVACQTPPIDDTPAQETPPTDDSNTEPAPNKPFEKVENIMNDVQSYVTKYADDAATNAWINEHILNTNVPPVTFLAGGVSSEQLSWEKTYGVAMTVTDFPDEAPFIRVLQPITYVNAEQQLRLELTLTIYPGYPVLEYEGTLYNDATGNSCTLSELQAIDEQIDLQNSVHILHAMKGSTYGTTLVAGTDYAPLTYSNFEGGGVTLAVTTGRPSETYLPYFNLENPEYNTGTIAILNWQGSWKASFTQEASGIKLRAGQYETNFVLQSEESVRFPGMVLLFYKGDYMNGQNVYRRWIYQCNLFREQGEHMKSTNVLLCSPTTSEQGDLASLDMYENQTDLLRLVDKYNIDAGDATHGWYQTEGRDWGYVGNWTPNEKYYPNGLKPVSDAVKDAGLQFALWFEPERLYKGTQISEDLKDSIIGVAADGSVLLGDNIPNGQLCLINYADERAVEYVINLLNESFKEYGVDQYRQDYNIQPAAYWSAFDQYEAKSMGIARTGLTENHACTGYLTVWSRLQELNPGMYYDACATGGTRYDLSTMRYSFLHTRSDEWANIENAQSQAYGASMWFLYCGTGFTNLSTYDVRSHIGNSIGVGISSASQASALESALEEWTDLASYLFYDYYPLTGYAGTSKKTMSLQFDSPEEGRGMFITYFRQKDSLTISPRGLDPDATYIIWNRDDRAGSEKSMLGAEIMEGILLESKASTALVYEYCLAEGENTEDFQKQTVATGLGSTDFEPSTVTGTAGQKVTVPTVSAVYAPNGMSDAELVAAYDIEADNAISFVGYDYMSAGSIYAISKNIYDGVQRSGAKLASGWEALKKYTISVEVAGGWYPYTQWDGMVFAQQPYVKEIDGTYFLWLANTTGLSDSDGAWQNWSVRIRWTDTKGATTTSQSFVIHCEGKKAQRFQYVQPADATPSDYLYRIDEAIFGSFSYTGYGVELDGSLWYEVDMSKCGYITPAGSKAPDEKRSIQSQTTMFGEADGVQLYTQYRDGEYWLYFRNAAFMGARTSLVWIDVNGEYCAQTFLVN